MLRNLFGFLEAAQRNRNHPTEAKKPGSGTANSHGNQTRKDLHGLYVDDSDEDLLVALNTSEDVFSQVSPSPPPEEAVIAATPEPEEFQAPAVLPEEPKAVFLKIALQQSIENRLIQAGLLSPMQLRVMMEVDRQHYPDLSVGEIVLLRNWVKPETLEFFLNLEAELSASFSQLPIEQRLQKAALVSEADIQHARHEQAQIHCNLDKILVLNGVVNQETVDYFTQLG